MGKMIFVSLKLHVGSFYTNFCKTLNKFYHILVNLRRRDIPERTIFVIDSLGGTRWHLIGEVEGLTSSFVP
jgi:hypothetical protein